MRHSVPYVPASSVPGSRSPCSQFQVRYEAHSRRLPMFEQSINWLALELMRKRLSEQLEPRGHDVDEAGALDARATLDIRAGRNQHAIDAVTAGCRPAHV